MKSRLVATCLLFVFLAGCGSIPLGTMWKMYRMGPEALYETDPTDVRVAVKSDNWVLDREKFDWGIMGVDLEIVGAVKRDWEFVLEDVSDVEIRKLRSAREGQRWRVYRIRESDLESFQNMQAELPELLKLAEKDEGNAEAEEKNTFQIGVAFLGDRDPEVWLSKDRETYSETLSPSEIEELDQRKIPYRLDLQLFADDGFFPLIKESTIPAAWLGIEKQDS